MNLNKKNLAKMIVHMWIMYSEYKKNKIKCTVPEFIREFIGEYESNVL